MQRTKLKTVIIMNITNPWLTPYQRSYHQIKQKLIDGLKSITDSKGKQLITDVSEGNILVIWKS